MFHNASHIYGIPERPFIRYISSKTFETNTCPQTYFGLKCMNMSLLNKTCAYGLRAMILLAGNGVKGNHPVPVRIVDDESARPEQRRVGRGNGAARGHVPAVGFESGAGREAEGGEPHTVGGARRDDQVPVAPGADPQRTFGTGLHVVDAAVECGASLRIRGEQLQVMQAGPDFHDVFKLCVAADCGRGGHRGQSEFTARRRSGSVRA